MQNKEEILTTESSENYSAKATDTLPIGSRLSLETIISLAQKVSNSDDLSEIKEYAREIRGQATKLLKAYDMYADRALSEFLKTASLSESMVSDSVTEENFPEKPENELLQK